MARINVEQKALTDSRFSHLGALITDLRNREDHTVEPGAIGIGVMVYVWNECQERGEYVLDRGTINLIGQRLFVIDLASMICESGLGTPNRNGKVRIRGTEGRIEWLNEQRKHGKKGGRPRKKPTLFKSENPRVLDSNNPPAPAPAPAPEEKNTRPTGVGRSLDTRRNGNGLPPGFSDWWLLYREACRLHARTPGAKKRALDVWKRRKLEPHANAIIDRLAVQIDDHEQQIEKKAFIAAFPDGHRWLRDSRWTDETID